MHNRYANKSHISISVLVNPYFCQFLGYNAMHIHNVYSHKASDQSIRSLYPRGVSLTCFSKIIKQLRLLNNTYYTLCSYCFSYPYPWIFKCRPTYFHLATWWQTISLTRGSIFVVSAELYRDQKLCSESIMQYCACCFVGKLSCTTSCDLTSHAIM